MGVDEAYERIMSSYRGDPGRFYSPGTGVGLGKGCIYKDCLFALFDPDQGRYRTALGTGYVLTHECDVEEGNDRPYNDDLLICPLIPLADVVANYVEDHGPTNLIGFLGNLGARRISRLLYLPPIAGELPHGSVMFLNKITHARADSLRNGTAKLCAVTGYGLAEVEFALESHLFRPKVDRLAFVPPDIVERP